LTNNIITGQIDARYDSNNYINGSFTIPIKP
jgi:hypothetical protein